MAAEGNENVGEERQADVPSARSGSNEEKEPSVVKVGGNPLLLSDRARQPAKRPSLWELFVWWCGFGRLHVEQGEVQGDLTEADCTKEGYEPFCRIGRLTTCVRFRDTTVAFLVLLGDHAVDVWSLIPPPARRGLLTPDSVLVAAMYIEALEKDCLLGGCEQNAIDALKRCLCVEGKSLGAAHCVVGVSLLLRATRDGQVDEMCMARVEAFLVRPFFPKEDVGKIAAYVFMYRVNECAKKRIPSEHAIPQFQAMGKRLGIPEDRIKLLMESLKVNLDFAATTDVLHQRLLAGHFPVVHECPVALRAGETAFFVHAVKVLEQKTETLTNRIYVGTRLKVGSVPLYLGGSAPMPVSRDVTKEVGTGWLVITNERVVLVGTKLNYSIALSSVFEVEHDVHANVVQIHCEGRHGGRFYVLPDGSSAAAAILRTLLARRAPPPDLSSVSSVPIEPTPPEPEPSGKPAPRTTRPQYDKHSPADQESNPAQKGHTDMDLASQVMRMYRQIEIGKSPTCRRCIAARREAGRICYGPHSLWHAGKRFQSDKYRVLFVGKCAGGEVGEPTSYGFRDTRKDAADYFMGNPSAFWRYTRTICGEVFGNEDEAWERIAMTNLVKCHNQDAGGKNRNPTKKMQDCCLKQMGVFWKEIKILQPRLIVFYTGEGFDRCIDPYRTGDDFRDIADRQDPLWWHRAFLKNGRISQEFLRTAHPGFKPKPQFVGDVAEWIRDADRRWAASRDEPRRRRP